MPVFWGEINSLEHASLVAKLLTLNRGGCSFPLLPVTFCAFDNEQKYMLHASKTAVKMFPLTHNLKIPGQRDQPLKHGLESRDSKSSLPSPVFVG